jgi:tetratricopeptide (TPR) repeat protein
MPGLPLELIAHLPGTGPGFEFRRIFVQLAAAASTGQFAQIPSLARRALSITDAQGWFALAATVHLLVGGAMAASGQSKEVLESYREARRLARQISDPSGPKMAVTSAMAEAGALMGQGQYREARQIYLEAARDADHGAEAMSSMDARRMASYCAEQNGDFDAAWDDAQAAVSAARNLEGEARRDSTLPALLHRMQEMARQPELRARNLTSGVERDCQSLLGLQWTGVLDRTKSLLRNPSA